MFETLLSAMFDRLPVLRTKKVLVTAVLSVVEFLLGLLLITNVSSNWSVVLNIHSDNSN